GHGESGGGGARGGRGVQRGRGGADRGGGCWLLRDGQGGDGHWRGSLLRGWRIRAAGRVKRVAVVIASSGLNSGSCWWASGNASSRAPRVPSASAARMARSYSGASSLHTA